MTSKIKFKIGAFSKLCQVTVKTLRHYEQLGLLTPSEVDQWTGYRYYDIAQLRRMNRIVYLKQLGLSLDQITELFDRGREFPDRESIREKIGQCTAEIVRMEQRRAELVRLENDLQQQEKIMEKVIEKTLPARIFAAHRRRIDSYAELFDLCPNIIGPEMARLGCECPDPQYCFTVEYNEECGEDIDIEYFEAVSRKGEDSELISFRELPQVPVALCIDHLGAYENMPRTFEELYAFTERNGYEAVGHARFCYIDGVWNKESEQEWLTQIQLPVRKL